MRSRRREAGQGEETTRTARRWSPARRRFWHRLTGMLVCVVVFCTTYALILPAITLEKDPDCGLEAHTHDDSCYEETLICGYEEGELLHRHEEDCYLADGTLICELSDSEVHTHDDSCYAQILICDLEEHVHDDACYAADADEMITDDPAAEDLSSDDLISEDLIQDEAVTDGQTAPASGSEILLSDDTVLCGYTAHQHTEDCYTPFLSCGLEEHLHTLECLEASTTRGSSSGGTELIEYTADIQLEEPEEESDGIVKAALSALFASSRTSSELPSDETAGDSDLLPADDSASEASDPEDLPADSGTVTDSAYLAELLDLLDLEDPEELTEYLEVTAWAEPGALPDDAELVVTILLQEDSLEETEEILEDSDIDYAGLFALDISFVDAEGQTLEPESGSVQVEISLDPDLLPDTADTDSISVQHLNETRRKTRAETVADVAGDADGIVEVGRRAITAEFEVESFSTFTITWTKRTGTTAVYDAEFSITVHYVDADGTSIASDETDTYTPKLDVELSIADTFTKTVEGSDSTKTYTYSTAYLVLDGDDTDNTGDTEDDTDTENEDGTESEDDTDTENGDSTESEDDTDTENEDDDDTDTGNEDSTESEDDTDDGRLYITTLTATAAVTSEESESTDSDGNTTTETVYTWTLVFYDEDGEEVGTLTWTSEDDPPELDLYLVYEETSTTTTGLLYLTDDSLISDGCLKLSPDSTLKDLLDKLAEAETEVSYTWYKSTDDGNTYSPVEQTMSGTSTSIPSSTASYDEQYLCIRLDDGGLTSSRTSVQYYVALTYTDENGSVVTICSEIYDVTYGQELLNGSFEAVKVSGTNQQFSNEDYLEDGIWQTTGTGEGTKSNGTSIDGKDIEIINIANNYSTFKSSYAWYDDETDDGAPDGDQFAELNCEAAGALYQDVLTWPGQSMNYWFSHRARGSTASSTEEYDTMYLVIMPTETALTAVKTTTTDEEGNTTTTYSELETQEQLEAYLNSLDNVTLSTTKASEESVSVLYNQDGILVIQISSDDQDWHDVDSNETADLSAYIPTSYMTRFFFVSGVTASGNNTVGNFLDKVGFSQELPEAGKGKFILYLKKEVYGLTEEQFETLMGNLTFEITATGDDASSAPTLKAEQLTVTDSDGTDSEENEETDTSTDSDVSATAMGDGGSGPGGGDSGGGGSGPGDNNSGGDSGGDSGDSGGDSDDDEEEEEPETDDTLTATPTYEGSEENGWTVTWHWTGEITSGSYTWEITESGYEMEGYVYGYNISISPGTTQTVTVEYDENAEEGVTVTVTFINTYTLYPDVVVEKLDGLTGDSLSGASFVLYKYEEVEEETTEEDDEDETDDESTDEDTGSEDTGEDTGDGTDEDTGDSDTTGTLTQYWYTGGETGSGALSESTSWSTDENDAKTLTTDEDGLTSILSSVTDGTYYLVETTAPDGYSLLSYPVIFVVEDGEVVSASCGSSDLTVTVDATYDDDGALTYRYTITVNNVSGYELPETGGAGTLGYTLAGLALMTAALCGGAAAARRQRRRA